MRGPAVSFSVLAVAAALAGGAMPAGAQGPAAEERFQNPVIAGDFADPSIIRAGDTYYASGTSSEWAPHYPVYTSKDLVNWEHVGHIFEEMPQWTSGSFWAPELYHRNGTFYAYYTARRKSDKVSVIGVATTDDPRKGFTDRGIICEWGSEAIDGFVFQDDDGKDYFSWKAYGLEKDKPITFIVSEMTDDLLRLKGEPFELLGTDGKPLSAEGQVMMKRGDWHYLFYSTKGCCGRGCDYQLEVARAKGVRGPWETSPVNPILAGGGAWKCPGHGTLVDLPDGRSYFLYHAYHARENVFTGRQGLLGEIAWQDNGWPVFAAGRTPAAGEASPLGKAQAAVRRDFADRFDTGRLSPSWQWDLLHPPVKKVADGVLELGVSDRPDASEAGTILGVRVEAADYVLTAAIDPAGAAKEGIGIYGDARNALVLRVEDAGLALTKVQDGGSEVLATAPRPEGETLYLRMTARGDETFGFSASSDGSEWQAVGPDSVGGSFLPPWDRAPRAGLVVAGKAGETGRFDSMEIRYGKGE